MSLLHHESVIKRADELVQTVYLFSQRGWCPATSSNFSFRILNEDLVIITQTGVDKDYIDLDNMMVVSLDGRVVEPEGAQPSAETLIHTALYKHFDKAHSVLHVHTPLSTVLSMKYLEKGEIRIKGYEMQKALEGITDHNSEIVFPIFPNSQDMTQLSNSLTEYLDKNDDIHGLFIAGHGLYSWGTSIPAAKRTVEATEFLLECEFLRSQI